MRPFDACTEQASPLPNADGFDIWECLTDSSRCERKELVLNINLVCDTPPPKPNNATCLKDCLAHNSTTRCNCHCFCTVCDGCGNGCYDTCAGKTGCAKRCYPEQAKRWDAPYKSLGASAGPDPNYYSTEAPAPKAGIRVGDYKLLVECFNSTSQTVQGKVALFDLKQDPSESTDIALQNPDIVEKLTSRIVFYGAQAAVPMGDAPPWQGKQYFCAKCPPGRPKKGPQPFPQNSTWEPWCHTGTGKPCW